VVNVFTFTWYAFWIIACILWLGVIAWIYNDAEEKGHMGCLWAIILAAAGPIGLAVYLLFFHGVTGSAKRHSPRQAEDLRLRSIYRQPAGGSNDPESDSGHMPPVVIGTAGDPTFRDEDLELLIRAGMLDEAREYIEEMKAVALEVNDMKGLANYSRYDRKVTQAGSTPEIKNRRDRY
jgi:hypothetical protein